MKDRIIEMLERKERVSLECIDHNGFDSENPINKFILKLDNIIIKKAILGWVGCRDKFVVDAQIEEIEGSSLNENSFIIFEDELKYFEIKESEHTFNDLIDTAVQAWKDGVLKSVKFTGGAPAELRYKGKGDNDVNILFDQHLNYNDEVHHIKSLYTETFVIEGDSDIERLRDGAKITLTNNEKGVFNIISGLRSITTTETGAEIMGLNTFWLKGATVTQKRGSQCNK